MVECKISVVMDKWLNVYFQDWPRKERIQKAAEQWNLKEEHQYRYLGVVPEVLYRYRDQLVPLGGFDILN